jgi:hypothetical protein
MHIKPFGVAAAAAAAKLSQLKDTLPPPIDFLPHPPPVEPLSPTSPIVDLLPPPTLSHLLLLLL